MKIENIKFKAKKTLDGKWIKGDLAHHKDSDNVWMTDFEKRLTSPIDPSTICQLTGLTDCKGKEIWEHDLLQSRETRAIYEVVWDENGGYCRVIGKLEYKPFTHVLFKNGYYDDSPKVEKEIESITIGKPKKGLCPDKWLGTEFFIIKFK